VILQHHERYDGTGYPAGLAAAAICRGARIVAVADAFEVMTAPRSYKRPTSRARWRWRSSPGARAVSSTRLSCVRS